MPNGQICAPPTSRSPSPNPACARISAHPATRPSKTRSSTLSEEGGCEASHPRRGDRELGPASGDRVRDPVSAGCARGQPDRARRRARGGEGRPAHHARRAQRRARISRLADLARHRQARPRRGRIRTLRLGRTVGRTKPRIISALLRPIRALQYS